MTWSKILNNLTNCIEPFSTVHHKCYQMKMTEIITQDLYA